MTPGGDREHSLRRRLMATWKIWGPPLRWRLRATTRLWRPGTEGRIRSIARPSPFAGSAIDTPGHGVELERGLFKVSGWAVFPRSPVARIDVRLGDHPIGGARLGLPRPDVAELRGEPWAGVSGFELITDLSDWKGRDGRTVLHVLATSVGGERHELGPVAVDVGPPGEREAPEMPPPLPSTPTPPGDRRPRVLVCTHQLNLGGAQLYLLDLLRELIRADAIEPTVLSAMDGELREDLEELGIPVHISSLVSMYDLSSHIGRVEELAAWMAGRDFDVALVNTATALTFPAARAATQLGIPTVWAIHESFPISILWNGVEPDILDLAEEALKSADLALFEAEATQRLYEPPLEESQCLTVPYGLDLEPIERERAEFEAEAARHKARVPYDADVILCVGTIEPRKAQIPLALAFEQIADSHPDAHLVIVGGSKNPDSLALADQIEESPFGDRMKLVPVTPDVHSWYALADLFVCASDVESLPRTILEAMAFETPVLATEVFGIPELIEDGKTGWLCEPRDVSALAAGLDRFLSTPADERRAVAEAARRLVEERHSLPRYADRIAKLLAGVVEENSSESKRRIVTG